uniref:Uncharacterized protein n=1 Tax=Lepeophtheirus salmonis TaxID=72036 RepID=A0A0K2UNQ5_LEPSM
MNLACIYFRFHKGKVLLLRSSIILI